MEFFASALEMDSNAYPQDQLTNWRRYQIINYRSRISFKSRPNFALRRSFLNSHYALIPHTKQNKNKQTKMVGQDVHVTHFTKIAVIWGKKKKRKKEKCFISSWVSVMSYAEDGFEDRNDERK